ncbi:DUF86 domain-containing protein [bacterium]|nr:DUF86 domain-containing protein [bacterium]MBU1753708.1 DUF86 domain-containing protein [bacterium]
MYDKSLVLSMLKQIDDALEKIVSRSKQIQCPNDFTDSPSGMEKLDSICMLFMAIGEALKNIDKITSSSLFLQYLEIDWKGVIGFRDIIAHHYFDIDAEQIFWICEHKVVSLSVAIKRMIKDLS